MEVGVGVTKHVNQECSFPIISVVITWPSVPVYSQEMTDLWAKELTGGKEMLTALKIFETSSSYNPDQLKKLIDQVAEMSNIAEEVNKKIVNKEWLNYQLIERYNQLAADVEPQLKDLSSALGISLP